MRMSQRIGMMGALALVGLAAAATTAQAATKSKQPGYIAKDVAKQRGLKLDHTMEIGSIRYGELVTGWTGATRGPGAGKAYAFILDSYSRPKVSTELTAPAKRALRAHIKRNGLPTGKIEFGDHVTAGRNGELLQRPFSRDSGYMRFTVTERSGKQARYLVPINTDDLFRGVRSPAFGTPFKDLDTYGQHP